MKAFEEFFRELLGWFGFALAGYGMYEIHPPTAFIISGSFLFWLSTKNKEKKK